MVGYMKDNIVRVGEKIRNSSQEIENIKKRILEIRALLDGLMKMRKSVNLKIDEEKLSNLK
jgi:hypothetical protein